MFALNKLDESFSRKFLQGEILSTRETVYLYSDREVLEALHEIVSATFYTFEDKIRFLMTNKI